MPSSLFDSVEKIVEFNSVFPRREIHDWMALVALQSKKKIRVEYESTVGGSRSHSEFLWKIVPK